jgi:prephenate dehydratase
MAVKVYYLGPPGTFGEQAAIEFMRMYSSAPGRYAGEATVSQIGVLEQAECASHTRVIQSVAVDKLSFGVVPVENSLEGAVSETLDAILSTPETQVCAELVLPVEHHLIAAPGTKLEDVTVVSSHPQALGQCRAFLESKLPSGVRFDAALSTAASVREAVSQPGAAGIGTRRAAEVYGGVILAENIQDFANNKTRFLVLAHEDARPTGSDKTSLAFTVPDRPGSVVRVMQEFSGRGINLTRIESRPSREALGKYVFLLDFEGHRLDAQPAAALKAIAESGAELLPAGRPLGSYPRYFA